MGTWPPGQYCRSAAPRVLERLLVKCALGQIITSACFFLQISSAQRCGPFAPYEAPMSKAPPRHKAQQARRRTSRWHYGLEDKLV
jgi:hypothetical protein